VVVPHTLLRGGFFRRHLLLTNRISKKVQDFELPYTEEKPKVNYDFLYLSPGFTAVLQSLLKYFVK
jgi:hypothetical protein